MSHEYVLRLSTELQLYCPFLTFLTLEYLWPPCVADADIIFLPCGFYLSSSFFPRLISAVGDWMSTILPHMVSK